MYEVQFAKINEDIAKTKKAVFGFGCSFVMGQGALDQDLYEAYDWRVNSGNILIPQDHEVDEILRKYPNGVRLVETPDNETGRYKKEHPLDFSEMEYKNAFTQKLADKLGWAGINFGMKGNGNRGSINNLIYHGSHLNLKDIEEAVVVYVPSGIDRFDFAANDPQDHFKNNTIWPHLGVDHLEDDRGKLWTGYALTVYSAQHAIQEQINYWVYLKSWFDAYIPNTKFYIMPGWENRYTQKWWEYYMGDKGLVAQYGWEYFFKPNGHSTFSDLCLSQEGLPLGRGIHQYMHNGTPKHWLTKCCHPSAKGHAKLAEALYEKILSDKSS